MGCEERAGEPLGNHCEWLWTLLVEDAQMKPRRHRNFQALWGKHGFPQFVDRSGERPHPSCRPQLPPRQPFLTSL